MTACVTPGETMWLLKRDCGPFLDVRSLFQVHKRTTGCRCAIEGQWAQLTTRLVGLVVSQPRGGQSSESESVMTDGTVLANVLHKLSGRRSEATLTSLWSFEADSHVATTWLGNRLSSAALDSQSL